ncbi:MAG: ATP-binding protein [Nevskia sp.]|nr:ATP-binding protein [Nevskia sp.]
MQLKSIAWRAALPLPLVALALLFTLLLRQWANVPFWFMFLIAVIASAWIGGRISGWIAVILSTLSVDYFFTRPLYSLVIDPTDAPYFIAFTLSMIVGNWFGTWRQSTDVAARRTQAELESRVRAGSDELIRANRAREQAERERRIAELRWQAVFENSVVGVVLADEQGRIIASNKRYRALLGRGDGNTAGDSLAGDLAEPQRTSLNRQLAELVAGQRQRVELELPHRGGNGTPLWLRTHVTVVPGTPDFPRFLTAFCEDMSGRKHAEEALLAARSDLAHATRLTMMGELAASIAHEVNQPLSAVVTNSNAALRWLAGATPNLAEARSTINWIMRDAKRASDVIARIRALMRKAEQPLEPLNFNDVVRDSLDLVRSELARHKVEVELELDPALPTVMGERIQLQQVFLNLVINAIEAMAGVQGRPHRLFIRTASQAGEEPGIVAEITDNGPGVAKDNLEQLFAAFFTTKPEGTGLGLWISRSIIENHAGHLLALPNEDQGMRFRIVLPCTSEPAQGPAGASISGAPL